MGGGKRKTPGVPDSQFFPLAESPLLHARLRLQPLVLGASALFCKGSSSRQGLLGKRASTGDAEAHAHVPSQPQS